MIMSIKFNPAFKVLSKYQVRAAVKAWENCSRWLWWLQGLSSVAFWWVGSAAPLGRTEGIWGDRHSKPPVGGVGEGGKTGRDRVTV